MIKPVSQKWSASFSLLALLGMLLLTAGCATIFQGTKEKISVTSEPSGANVLVNNVQLGITPTVITVSKREPTVVIRFEKEGFQPAEVSLSRADGGWTTAGDLLMALPFGFFIDYTWGGAFKITTTEVNTVLKVQKKFERAEY